MQVFPVALEVAVIDASAVIPAAAKSRLLISFPTIWIGMAATLLCVEHVVYQDAADARRHRAPPVLEVVASVVVHIVVRLVADSRAARRAVATVAKGSPVVSVGSAHATTRVSRPRHCYRKGVAAPAK